MFWPEKRRDEILRISVQISYHLLRLSKGLRRIKPKCEHGNHLSITIAIEYSLPNWPLMDYKEVLRTLVIQMLQKKCALI
jgi:hypothetical protein